MINVPNSLFFIFHTTFLFLICFSLYLYYILLYVISQVSGVNFFTFL
nr:MAG TPA: hypothetical protein [Caudoviricetes sp.]